MAENGAADTAQQPAVQMNILGQFVRDLSFENVMARRVRSIRTSAFRSIWMRKSVRPIISTKS